MNELHKVLQSYGFDIASAEIKPFGSGLINHTWKIKNAGKDYILQRINTNVFKEPEAIAYNIRVVAEYLKEHAPGYFFTAPVITPDGKDMVHVSEDESYYRMFPFVTGSHSKDVLENAEQAFEGAKQFGRFTKLLSGFDVDQLKISLPSFHDLAFRYHQFLQSLETGNRQRIAESATLISFIKLQTGIVSEFESIQKNPAFKQRVTHHDTKISNVLFDSSGQAICVIDLDTIMPGYFISDVGDMMRTYLPTVSEEERDFSKIDVREDVYKAIVEGYGSEMNNELSPVEKKYFFYAATFMIYMQAVRFLTDHLNDDVYYGAKYAGHNLIRAGNQTVLLQKLMDKKDAFEKFGRL
jgi:Ser/Thr protein kinase RdoA (MazF antagonist)